MKLAGTDPHWSPAGSRGIGRATAAWPSRRRVADIAFLPPSTTMPREEQTANEIRALGATGDASLARWWSISPPAVRSRTMSRRSFGPIDILFNNAGHEHSQENSRTTPRPIMTGFSMWHMKGMFLHGPGPVCIRADGGTPAAAASSTSPRQRGLKGRGEFDAVLRGEKAAIIGFTRAAGLGGDLRKVYAVNAIAPRARIVTDLTANDGPGRSGRHSSMRCR